MRPVLAEQSRLVRRGVHALGGFTDRFQALAQVVRMEEVGERGVDQLLACPTKGVSPRVVDASERSVVTADCEEVEGKVEEARLGHVVVMVREDWSQVSNSFRAYATSRTSRSNRASDTWHSRV